MTTTLTIEPISEASVREGQEDLRPMLVAPGADGEWTIACWDSRDWYDLHNAENRRLPNRTPRASRLREMPQ
jgi:hypothetical protein